MYCDLCESDQTFNMVNKFGDMFRRFESENRKLLCFPQIRKAKPPLSRRFMLTARR